MADEKISKNGLTFRAGEAGYVFYDDSRFSGETGRAWAFSTIEEAAAWLLAQFTDKASDTAEIVLQSYDRHPAAPHHSIKSQS